MGCRTLLPRVWFVALSLAVVMFVSPPLQAESPADPIRGELERARSEDQGVDQSVYDSIAMQLDVASRIQKDFPAQAQVFRSRAGAWLESAERGRDPLLGARGQIVQRSYPSAVSRTRQGYAVYLPKDYDESKAYPLMVLLHGGSANGNLFLGVVLGNNMNWKEYDRHLWDEFTPRYFPDWIVVAPDGFGQIMWRFMGEQDVLDVVADAEKHYHVDADRVVLGGLSNGGVGAYSLGMRHASQFSAVLAIAGAPSWTKYAGGGIDRLQTEALEPLSAMSLAENAINTDFRFFHGHSDPGPMRPAYVEAFSKHIATLGVPYKEKWFDAGHDLLYLVVRQGALFKELAGVTRNRHPKEVRLVTGDYRAAEQHWLRVTRIDELPELARVRAVAEGSELSLETQNTRALALAWRDAPLAAGDKLRVRIDGQVVYEAARSGTSDPLQLTRTAAGWQVGAPQTAALSKRPGLAGPLTDAYYGALLHVYGTQNPEQTAALRKSAERGAHGWPLWLWRVDQRVIADRELTPELMRTHDLVIYATPGSHSFLSQIEGELPIRVEHEAVVVGDQRYSGRAVGTRYIYPNPRQPDRYVIVQAAPTVEGVSAGHNLPDFLPDYVVYDTKSTRSRPRLVFPGASSPLALGYFDGAWQIDPLHTQRAMLGRPTKAVALNEGDGPESADHDNPTSPLPVPVSPTPPPAPLTFATQPDTQAGKAARELAKRVATFTNYRGSIAGATWRLDDGAKWSIREREDCLAELDAQGVHVDGWSKTLATPVATPVQAHNAAVSGVRFRFAHAPPGTVIACELAARLRDVAEVVARHGIRTVHVLSAYRDHPYPSFHTLGLALDLSQFDGPDGSLVVKSDFLIDRGQETCAESVRARDDKDRRLHAIACDLAATHRFSSVLTPNYNAGHRDHFHLDIRPDDPRFFLR